MVLGSSKYNMMVAMIVLCSAHLTREQWVTEEHPDSDQRSFRRHVCVDYVERGENTGSWASFLAWLEEEWQTAFMESFPSDNIPFYNVTFRDQSILDGGSDEDDTSHYWCNNVTMSVHLSKLENQYRPAKMIKIKGDAFGSISRLLDFFHQRDTKIIVLVDSKISQIISGVLHNFPALKFLDLTNNMLHSFKLKVQDAGRLTHLSLARNLLSNITHKTLEISAPSLRKLNLDYNGITYIDGSVFRLISTLTHLFLRQNQLTDLDPTVFAHLTSLRHLDVAYNEISLMGDDQRRGFNSLTVLDLTGNQISEMQFCTVSQRSPNQTLLMAGNPVQDLHLVKPVKSRSSMRTIVRIPGNNGHAVNVHINYYTW